MFNSDDFDKQFNRTRKMIGIFAVVNAAIALVLTVGVVWVAWHFISKFWWRLTPELSCGEAVNSNDVLGVCPHRSEKCRRTQRS